MIRSLLLLLSFLLTAAEPAAGPPAPETAPVVSYLPIDGVIDEHRSRQFERTLKAAIEAKSRYVVVHLTTDGGRLDSAMEMLRELLKVDNKTTSIVAFIDNRAYSAGALIGYGCDRIYLTPDAYIGDIGVIFQSQDPVEPIKYAPEKFESPVRALLRQTAQHNGWDEAKLQKMTARNQELWRFQIDGKPRHVIEDDLPKFLSEHTLKKEDGVLILGKDRLLTYTAKEAAAEGMATAVVQDLDEVYRLLGTTAAQVHKHEPTQNEKLAETLGGWAPLLAALAMLFLILEFKMGGNGMFLILAAISGAIFLFCQFYLELAGAPEVLLIVLGVAAIAVEVFLFPTGGFLALGGAAAILVGLVLAFMPDGIQFNPGTEGWGDALGVALRGSIYAIAIFTGGAVLIISTLHRKVPSTLASPVAIDATSAGAVEAAAVTLAGKRGTARTMLRPAGFVVVEGQDLAATTEHGVMVDAGTAIEVVEARFGELIVRPVAAGAPA